MEKKTSESIYQGTVDRVQEIAEQERLARDEERRRHEDFARNGKAER